MTLRVLLADDHPVFRHGLRDLLEDTDDLQVVGEASSGEEAVSLAQETQPDVVLMDVKMPGISGIEASRRVHEVCPSARVLILTMFQDDGTVFAAMRAGARGYVLRTPTRMTCCARSSRWRAARRSSVRRSPRACWTTSAAVPRACRARAFRC